MHTVAPYWRAAALVLPLVAAAGCDWIPVRRQLDPSLYPVPTRPGAAYLRDDRPVARPSPSPSPPPADRLDLARDDGDEDRRLPSLPELRPISAEEALAPPEPTPMLDAALVRAEAVRSAALDGPIAAGAPTDPIASDAPPVPDPAEGTGPVEEVPPDLGPVVIEPPPMPEADPPAGEDAGASDSSPSPDAVDLPPLEPTPTEEGATTGPPTPTPTPTVEDRPGPGDEPLPPSRPEVEPGDHWRAGLENLRTLAEAEADRGDGSAEVWASRRRVLDWLAEAEAAGEVDDATLWQTVMVMLAEPDPDAMPPEPAPAEAPALRVSRVAFCREVVGFGRIDPIDADACRAGQVVLVYCELEGVAYEPEGDGHASRLSTTLEILPGAEDDAPALWSEALPVEDRCTRPRHDYFVGYRLTLPGRLSPGRYRLRVAQRDLVAGSDADGELPFSIIQEP